MSGGYFDYIQYRLVQLEDEVENLLDHETVSGMEISDEVRDSILVLLPKLSEVQKRIHLLDYYLESDIGLETYLERLKEIEAK